MCQVCHTGSTKKVIQGTKSGLYKHADILTHRHININMYIIEMVTEELMVDLELRWHS